MKPSTFVFALPFIFALSLLGVCVADRFQKPESDLASEDHWTEEQHHTAKLKRYGLPEAEDFMADMHKTCKILHLAQKELRDKGCIEAAEAGDLAWKNTVEKREYKLRTYGGIMFREDHHEWKIVVRKTGKPLQDLEYVEQRKYLPQIPALMKAAVEAMRKKLEVKP
jgi:hypothetical protein